MPDGSVDVVLACLTIHDIHDPGLRRQTIDEAARVDAELKGGSCEHRPTWP
ncbi:MAG TPA: hypothetical protein VIU11_09140 [Nakamurella sp.]